ncbi:hypothetical protein Tsubulata_006530 [Turnera subulata]|uniref:Leucine-rich repeat-containing N-terminal plant-type domain-containing protein n=1 Tax=Turnera subulata TaxID=218843 RepID=A0A9Q0JNV2_9ROSI|nr:hypothetical protein Tsubulata_006530 [Turnera subulata]
MEGDILASWKSVLVDPNNVLQSWNATLINPCTWFHVTCNSENNVTRVYGNKLNGTIPATLGNLTKLVSLDLYNNNLTGPIPSSLGNVTSLRRLNGNKLNGTIPLEVLALIAKGNLTFL